MYPKIILLACLISVSVVGACNVTSTKPTPTTKSYHFGTCIVAKFASFISLGQGKYIEFNDGVTSDKSTCDKQTADNQTVDPKLVVDFECGQLEFEISHSNNDSKIFVKAINGFYKDQNGTSHTFSNSTPLFTTTESGHYYKCNAEQLINLDVLDKSSTTVQLTLSNFAYEAYRTTTGTDFYKIPEECTLDAGQVSDLVRIGVGVCLVALVVIVLIAYFVGRRRWSERSSYESV